MKPATATAELLNQQTQRSNTKRYQPSVSESHARQPNMKLQSRCSCTTITGLLGALPPWVLRAAGVFAACGYGLPHRTQLEVCLTEGNLAIEEVFDMLYAWGRCLPGPCRCRVTPGAPPDEGPHTTGWLGLDILANSRTFLGSGGRFWAPGATCSGPCSASTP
jgi:hypothetical protein